MAKAAVRVPAGVREAFEAEVAREARRYVASGDAERVMVEWAGRAAVVSAEVRTGRGKVVFPLARLKYRGAEEPWVMEIWRPSKDRFDEEGEFPRTLGSAGELFSVAADFFLWDYGAFEAGSSYGSEPEVDEGPFAGPARLCREAAGGVPGLSEGAAERFGASAFVRDLEATLAFFGEAPRKLSDRGMLGRAELGALNGRLGTPDPLSARPVEHRMPRIRVLVAVARALGLVTPAEPKGTATLTAEAEGFRKRPALERWWLGVEALWGRVRWADLRDQNADHHQAGRGAIAALLGGLEGTLTYRTEPVWQEAFETFLLPALGDAGLVQVGVKTVQVTPEGREAFAALRAMAPEVSAKAGFRLERVDELLAVAGRAALYPELDELL